MGGWRERNQWGLILSIRRLLRSLLFPCLRATRKWEFCPLYIFPAPCFIVFDPQHICRASERIQPLTRIRPLKIFVGFQNIFPPTSHPPAPKNDWWCDVWCVVVWQADRQVGTLPSANFSSFILPQYSRTHVYIFYCCCVSWTSILMVLTRGWVWLRRNGLHQEKGQKEKVPCGSKWAIQRKQSPRTRKRDFSRYSYMSSTQTNWAAFRVPGKSSSQGGKRRHETPSQNNQRTTLIFGVTFPWGTGRRSMPSPHLHLIRHLSRNIARLKPHSKVEIVRGEAEMRWICAPCLKFEGCG